MEINVELLKPLQEKIDAWEETLVKVQTVVYSILLMNILL